MLAIVREFVERHVGIKKLWLKKKQAVPLNVAGITCV